MTCDWHIFTWGWRQILKKKPSNLCGDKADFTSSPPCLDQGCMQSRVINAGCPPPPPPQMCKGRKICKIPISVYHHTTVSFSQLIQWVDYKPTNTHTLFWPEFFCTILWFNCLTAYGPIALYTLDSWHEHSKHFYGQKDVCKSHRYTVSLWYGSPNVS